MCSGKRLLKCKKINSNIGTHKKIASQDIESLYRSLNIFSNEGLILLYDFIHHGMTC